MATLRLFVVAACLLGISSGCRTTGTRLSQLPGMGWLGQSETGPYADQWANADEEALPPSAKSRPQPTDSPGLERPTARGASQVASALSGHAEERLASYESGNYPDTGYPNPLQSDVGPLADGRSSSNSGGYVTGPYDTGGGTAADYHSQVAPAQDRYASADPSYATSEPYGDAGPTYDNAGPYDNSGSYDAGGPYDMAGSYETGGSYAATEQNGGTDPRGTSDSYGTPPAYDAAPYHQAPYGHATPYDVADQQGGVRADAANEAGMGWPTQHDVSAGPSGEAATSPARDANWQAPDAALPNSFAGDSFAGDNGEVPYRVPAEPGPASYPAYGPPTRQIGVDPRNQTVSGGVPHGTPAAGPVGNTVPIGETPAVSQPDATPPSQSPTRRDPVPWRPGSTS